MSGIAGFYANNIELRQRENAYSSECVLDTLKDRGPYALGSWNDDQCQLLLTCFGILDQDNRLNQPFSQGTWVLSYNGDIYNYKDLKLELKKEGCEFTTDGDAEVLYKAIETWGVEVTLDRIIGVFAFAAYNKRTKDLHIVRDRMGVKPVYIYTGNDYFIFGSNCAAIVNGLTEKKWPLDWDAVQSYFMLGTTFQGNSLFKGIRRLKPAEHITVNSQMEQSSRIYWKPKLRKKLTSDEIVSVVQDYAVSDVPIASFLSGGVDSSSVAVSLKDKDLTVIHLDSEEKKYAQIVAKSIGTNLVVSDMPSMSDVDATLDKHILSFGEPSSSSVISEAIISSCIENGIKVGILGCAGNELFLGRTSTCMPELIQENISWNAYTKKPYSELNQQLRWVMRSPELFKVRNVDDENYFQKMRNYVADSMFLEGFPASASNRWVDLQTFAIGHLNVTLDAVSMASSTQLRIPFLDHRLVEGALSMNANDLVTMSNGRKSPLVDILKKNKISPTVWQRTMPDFEFGSQKLEQINRKRRKAMSLLQEREIIHNNVDNFASGENYNNMRDDNHLIASAHSFYRWLECWEHRLESI